MGQCNAITVTIVTYMYIQWAASLISKYYIFFIIIIILLIVQYYPIVVQYTHPLDFVRRVVDVMGVVLVVRDDSTVG